MLDLNNMSRTDLMKRIDVACKAFSEIHKAIGERTIKEWDLSSAQDRLQVIYQYDAKENGSYTFFKASIGGILVSTVTVGCLSVLTKEIWPYIFLIPIFLVFIFLTYLESYLKRKKLNKKFQKQVKEAGTIERLQNEIREAQRQLAIAENTLKEVRCKNDSVIKVFPSDYQSLPKLQEIYQILYNQRATNWAGAVSLYLQDEMQREKMQEEIRHNQQMEQARQELIRKQEEQARRLEYQYQMRMEQEERLARDIAHEIEGLRSDLSSRR